MGVGRDMDMDMDMVVAMKRLPRPCRPCSGQTGWWTTVDFGDLDFMRYFGTSHAGLGEGCVLSARLVQIGKGVLITAPGALPHPCFRHPRCCSKVCLSAAAGP